MRDGPRLTPPRKTVLMSYDSGLSRRSFLVHTGALGAGLALAGGDLLAGEAAADAQSGDMTRTLAGIADPVVRGGMEAAIGKNMIPAAVETDYPGYFWISADGRAYGNATWPGLDSWQMAGAYLLMGRTRMVLDYFDFVRASQRKDGHIPFAIFPGDTPAERLSERSEHAARHLYLQAAETRGTAGFEPAAAVVDRAV